MGGGGGGERCVHVCVRACARTHMCVCVGVCVCVWVRMHAIVYVYSPGAGQDLRAFSFVAR